MKKQSNEKVLVMMLMFVLFLLVGALVNLKQIKTENRLLKFDNSLLNKELKMTKSFKSANKTVEELIQDTTIKRLLNELVVDSVYNGSNDGYYSPHFNKTRAKAQIKLDSIHKCSEVYQSEIRTEVRLIQPTQVAEKLVIVDDDEDLGDDDMDFDLEITESVDVVAIPEKVNTTFKVDKYLCKYIGKSTFIKVGKRWFNTNGLVAGLLTRGRINFPANPQVRNIELMNTSYKVNELPSNKIALQ